MKKVTLVLAVLLVACVGLNGVALAKMISGKVAMMNAETNILELSRTNPETGAEEKVELSIAPETTYTGVASSSELAAGDLVLVQAEEDAATPGSWKATSVKVAKV